MWLVPLQGRVTSLKKKPKNYARDYEGQQPVHHVPRTTPRHSHGRTSSTPQPSAVSPVTSSSVPTRTHRCGRLQEPTGTPHGWREGWTWRLIRLTPMDAPFPLGCDTPDKVLKCTVRGTCESLQSSSEKQVPSCVAGNSYSPSLVLWK